MDDASFRTTSRKFPSHTTDELKIACMDYLMGIHPCGEPAPGLVDAMKLEISRRAAGLSVVRKPRK